MSDFASSGLSLATSFEGNMLTMHLFIYTCIYLCTLLNKYIYFWNRFSDQTQHIFCRTKQIFYTYHTELIHLFV